MSSSLLLHSTSITHVNHETPTKCELPWTTPPTHLLPATSIILVQDDSPTKLKMPMSLMDAVLLYVLEDDNISEMDLTFICKDGDVGGHRLIFAAASKFLAAMLSDFDQDPWRPATVILPDVTTDVMEAVRSLCYIGVANFPEKIETEVHKLLQLLLIGDDGNFMTALIEHPVDVENGKFDLVASQELECSGESSAAVHIVIEKEVLEELVAQCSARSHQPVADAILQQRNRGAGVSRRIEGYVDKLQVLRESSISSITLPAYPQLKMSLEGASSPPPKKKKRGRKPKTVGVEKELFVRKRKTPKVEGNADENLKPQRQTNRIKRLKTDKNVNGEERMTTRQSVREEKRDSVTSISSTEDLFTAVKVRKCDKKFLVTPTSLEERLQKPRPSLDIDQINKLYESLGQLTRRSSSSNSTSPC